VAATAGNGTLLASLSLLASPYTFSIWLRRKTGTGTVQITVDGTTYVTAAVTADWQRFSTTLTPTAGTRTPGIRIVTSGDAVYAWGAQLSDSASLDPYMPNFGAAPSAAAAHGPRLDYDPSTLAAKGLLIEEQRTNLLTYSEQFNDAVYVKVATTVTANATTAPDGTATADKIISDATNVQHSIGPSVTFASNTTYSLSVFAKAAERSSFAFGPRGNGKPITTTFNLSTLSFSGDVSTGGTIVSKSYQLLPNGWIRVVLVFTTDNSGTVPSNVNFSDTNFAVVAGNGVDGIFLWGAQLEAGPFATSYIPTAAASVTRNADVAFVATSQFPYSATEGTLVANVSLIAIKSTVQMYAELGDGTFNNRMGIYSASTTAEAIIDTVGSRQATLSIGSVTSGSAIKSALAYKLNDIAACLNGGSVSSDTSALIPIVNVLAIGSQTARFADINGHIRQITYIPRRLTNAELQARTA
jgi:hypothetical protein